MTFEVTKDQLKDTMDRPLTQSLFIDIKYDPNYAVYCLKEDDHEFQGTVYPSLKRLYLEMEDPTEYLFANTYLLGWNHWCRLKDNQLLAPHFAEWAEELELKIRAKAVKEVMELAEGSNSFQAAKWLADRGWDKRAPGRPSEKEKLKDKKVKERLNSDIKADIKRLEDYKQKAE